jgi:cytochrome c553
MLVSFRNFLFVAAFIAFPSFAVAGGKTVAPAVPGFARFYTDEKADAAKGGHLLFNELHCARCHAPRVAPAGEKDLKPAPILDGVGARVKRSYLKQFLADPQTVKPGTKMPNLFVGMDADEKKTKVEALVHFLASSGSPAQARPDRKAVTIGQDLYSKVGCVACHGTRDAKGEQDKVFATSVPLGDLKTKYNLASLKALLENPLQTRPHGRMPGILAAKEASDVANYLLQSATPGLTANNMKYSYYEGSWKNLPDFTKIKPVKSGEASDFELSVARRLNDCALRFEGLLRIETEGNYTFHLTSDDGSKLWIDDKQVVNNDGIHAPTLKSGKTKLTKGVHKVVVGVFNGAAGFELHVEFEGPGVGKQPLGPRIMLTEEPAKPGSAIVGDAENFPLEPALVAKGKDLFAAMGCANCHQMGGEKKRLDAPAQANLKAEGGCLAATPKKGVPWYGLSGIQQAALSAALKKPLPDKNDDPREVVKTALTAFNCYACHERDKVGGVTEELSPFFTSTFKEWGDETRLPPSLTGVGAKLNPAYFKKILEQGSHDRPYMNTRMPKFGPSASHLVGVFVSLDPAEKAPKVAFDQPLTKIKSAGRQLVGLPKGKTEAASCINCHNVGGVKNEGAVQGIDMTIMAERLNREWFHNYLLDPSKYRKGTRMPTSFPDGTTPYKILDGKADTQIEAIWTYLADGKAATLPPGMNKMSIPLVPVGEAIIYRNFIQGAGSRAIGVGFPEHASLAFDANEIRLAMIWQGAFMDARRHWTDRGVGFEPPLGENVLSLPTGAPFFILGQADEAWPTKTAKELGYKFKGYRLTDDQRPTFLYSFNDIKIEDTPNAIETKGNPAIRRTLAIFTENPIDKLYYRAAVADKIVAEKDGWYRINEWRMRIESAPPPVIRQAGKKMELLVPVQFKGNNAKIVQEYVW